MAIDLTDGQKRALFDALDEAIDFRKDYGSGEGAKELIRLRETLRGEIGEPRKRHYTVYICSEYHEYFSVEAKDPDEAERLAMSGDIMHSQYEIGDLINIVTKEE